MTIHRKVHLFDIDIPGKIKFKVGLSCGVRESVLTMRSRRARRSPEERRLPYLILVSLVLNK